MEDNIESDVSRSKLQRSESTTESIDSNRKHTDGSPEESVSNNELSVTSEDTTLVEDSSSTINGDVATRSASPDQHTSGKPSNEDSVNSVNKLADGISAIRLGHDNQNGQTLTLAADENSSSNSAAAAAAQGIGSSKHKNSSQHSMTPTLCNGLSHAESRQKRLAARHELCRRGATCTLSARYQPVSHECSVQSCLHQFTSAELLTGNNKFGCENCTRNKHKNSGKYMLRLFVLYV